MRYVSYYGWKHHANANKYCNVCLQHRPKKVSYTRADTANEQMFDVNYNFS